MAKPELGQIQSVVRDPMLSDNFTFEIPNVPTGSDDDQQLLMHCQQVQKPGVTINAVEVQLFGHTLEFASNKTFSHDLSVTYYENSKGTIMRILEKWAALIRDTKTGLGKLKYGDSSSTSSTDGYARTGIIKLFDPTGNMVLEYTVYGLWPSQVPDSQMDGSNSSALTHGTTFKYDYYERTGGSTA